MLFIDFIERTTPHPAFAPGLEATQSPGARAPMVALPVHEGDAGWQTVRRGPKRRKTRTQVR